MPDLARSIERHYPTLLASLIVGFSVSSARASNRDRDTADDPDLCDQGGAVL